MNAKGRHRRPFALQRNAHYFLASSFFISPAAGAAPGAAAGAAASGAGAGAGAAAGAGAGGGGAGLSQAASAATDREAAMSNFFTLYSLQIDMECQEESKASRPLNTNRRRLTRGANRKLPG